MVNEFKIPIENKRPVETVCELKDQVPSFEEFMKTYESDGEVNDSYQAEFSNCNNMGADKGYGPCSWNNSNCTCYSQSELQRQYWAAINDNNTNIQIKITNI
jgi:hypothetical protein